MLSHSLRVMVRAKHYSSAIISPRSRLHQLYVGYKENFDQWIVYCDL